MKRKEMKHECADGYINVWIPRVDNPKECTRCKARLDRPKAKKEAK